MRENSFTGMDPFHCIDKEIKRLVFGNVAIRFNSKCLSNTEIGNTTVDEYDLCARQFLADLSTNFECRSVGQFNVKDDNISSNYID